MSLWTDLVKKTYNENKHKAGYKLKNAMKDAKKTYKSVKKQGGNGVEGELNKSVKKRNNNRTKKNKK